MREGEERGIGCGIPAKLGIKGGLLADCLVHFDDMDEEKWELRNIEFSSRHGMAERFFTGVL